MTEGVFDDYTPADQQEKENREQEQNYEFAYLGKKYSTPEELDKAYGHANHHIGKLEEENQALREAAQKVDKQEEAIQEVLKALNKKPDQPDEPDQPKESESDDAEQLEQLVRNILNKDKAETTEQENLRKVRESLESQYGDKAAEKYKQRANELGIDLDELSRKSPKAVLELFGAQQQQTTAQGSPTSTVNSLALGKAPAPNTQEAIDQMYKEGKINREKKHRMEWELMMKKPQ